MRVVVVRIFTALRQVPVRPSSTILRYVGALSGALAIISFLVLPIIKVSILGLNITRTGTELIQSTFESSDILQIAFSVALTLALIAAGSGALLLLASRHKHCSMLGGLSLSVLVGLGVYLVVREESPKLIAIGLWLSLLLLVVMSTATLLAWSYTKAVSITQDQSDEAAEL
jgi:hypothetical protein